MRDLFNLDSPIMVLLGRIMNIFHLSLLWLLCSVPIITIGPATAATYYVTIKMVRNEDRGIVKPFFHAFLDNFRQGIVYSIIFLLGCVILFIDLRIVTGLGYPLESIMRASILILSICFLTVMFYVFPLQAQFSNTILGTIKNALFFALKNPITSVVVFFLNLLPVCIALISIEFLIKTLPLWLFIAPGGIAYLCSYFFVKIFDRVIESKQNSSDLSN